MSDLQRDIERIDDLVNSAWRQEYEAWQRIRARLEQATPAAVVLRLVSALEELADYVDERTGDNECRPLENARAAIASAQGVK